MSSDCARRHLKLSGLSAYPIMSTGLPDPLVSSQVQQAREAFGTRLREIRKDANLTGRALASSSGIHFTKVSRIENGRQSPSENSDTGSSARSRSGSYARSTRRFTPQSWRSR